MTQKRKARVGDTIRHNGKNPAYTAGEEFVVTQVTDGRFVHPYPNDGEISTYWVSYDHPEGDYGSAWESQFDIVEPEPELKEGDRVKLTPKDGGETVIYGVVAYVWVDRNDLVDVKIEGDVPAYGGRPFNVEKWNIEHVTPSTEEILNGLGENAYVAHRTDPDYYGYYKRDGEWYDADSDRSDLLEPATVAMWIDDNDFEIIFEGIKDA